MTTGIERKVIRSARERAGIMSDRELTEKAGIPYSTYMQQRRTDPGSIILREMRRIIKVTDMKDEDILAWVKGSGT